MYNFPCPQLFCIPYLYFLKNDFLELLPFRKTLPLQVFFLSMALFSSVTILLTSTAAI